MLYSPAWPNMQKDQDSSLSRAAEAAVAAVLQVVACVVANCDCDFVPAIMSASCKT